MYDSVSSDGSEESASDKPAIWRILRENGLLDPNTGRFYEAMIDKFIALFVATIVAGAFLYLAFVPDAAISRAYGDSIARAGCACISAVFMFDAIECFGVWRALHGDAMLRIFRSLEKEQVGRISAWPRLVGGARLVGRISIWEACSGTFVYIVVMSLLLQVWSGASPLTITTAILSAIYRGIMRYSVGFLRDVALSQSASMVKQLRDTIEAYPITAPHPNEYFWKQALERYQELDSKLEELWKSMIIVYGPLFVSRSATFAGGIILVFKAQRESDMIIQGASIVMVAYIMLSLLSHLYSLASITDSCMSRSISSSSIFAAAVRAMKANHMTEKQKEDYRLFLHCLEISPTGVQMGVLVDTACVLRLGVPLVTGFASLISYALATLEIAPDV